MININKKKYLAFDFGASNGRVIVGKYNGLKLEMEEIHRFDNIPVFIDSTLYWDILRLFLELKAGILKATLKYKDISSLGVETWGCDFGLLDKNKNLLSNPVHYRDKRTNNISKEVFRCINDKEIYRRTGAQILELNTLYQMYSMSLLDSPILENAEYFLMMGDLFNFFLTGNIFCEYTNATTTQILDQKNRKWEEYILESLSLPKNIFPEIKEPGSIVGNLSKGICNELNCMPIPVALPAYDTSSEITAIPISSKNQKKKWAYLCCGTWAVVGIIADSPIITKEGFLARFGNEGGVNCKSYFLKNIAGLWIIQQCRKKWIQDRKRNISWDKLIELTNDSIDRNVFIDVDDPSFEKEIFNMPAAIIRYFKKTNQRIPETIGEFSRSIFESLVLKYLLNIKSLEKIIGEKIELLHLVGGGSKNELLCQWISSATGIPLIAGPAETTTSGNILLQMLALGDIKTIEEGREIIINSIKINYCEPKNSDKWNVKLEIYRNKINRNNDHIN
jgi:sugar (pentulose or hexulose) kinase